MKTIAKLVLSASALFLTSCSGGEKTERGEAVNTSNAPAASTAPAQQLNAQNRPAETATAVAANPPHGEPNHRCDIPVGAPLNAAAQPSLKPVTPRFNPQVQGAVAAGTNPPHGQPGHDCAVPVGAPLNR